MPKRLRFKNGDVEDDDHRLAGALPREQHAPPPWQDTDETEAEDA